MAPSISLDFLSKSVGHDYLVQIPVFLVFVAGMIISLLRYRRYPKVSAFAFVSFAILTFVQLVFPIVFWSMSLSLNAQQIATPMTVLNVAASVIRALAYILLIVAIFGWRREKTTVAP